jgi:hypothetical protein
MSSSAKSSNPFTLGNFPSAMRLMNEIPKKKTVPSTSSFSSANESKNVTKSKKSYDISAKIQPPGASYTFSSFGNSVISSNKRAPAFSFQKRPNPRPSSPPLNLALPIIPGARKAPSFTLTPRRQNQAFSSSTYFSFRYCVCFSYHVETFQPHHPVQHLQAQPERK